MTSPRLTRPDGDRVSGVSYADDLQVHRAAALLAELGAEMFTPERHRLALRTQRLVQLLRAAQRREGQPGFEAEASRLDRG